jgi:hypothetical protein
MYPNPYLQRILPVPCGRTLDRCRAADRGCARLKDDIETVALGLDLCPPLASHHAPNDAPVSLQQLARRGITGALYVRGVSTEIRK